MKYMIILTIVCLIVGCTIVNKRLGLDDDNFAEEVVEEVIKAKTGLDVDLTPGSKENE